MGRRTAQTRSVVQPAIKTPPIAITDCSCQPGEKSSIPVNTPKTGGTNKAMAQSASVAMPGQYANLISHNFTMRFFKSSSMHQR